MGTPNCASPHDELAPKMLSAIFRVYTFFLGFLYPAYASYKAIESEATDDDTQWLTYWVVYSMLMIFESFADYSVFWIPGYRFAKCGFIFWLASPRFKGAIMLYEKVFKDALKAAEPIIDSVSAQSPRATSTPRAPSSPSTSTWTSSRSSAARRLRKP